MTKIIWIFIGLNTTAFLVAIVAFFIVTNGKKIGYMEGGWSIILATASVVLLLLAFLPLRFGDSTFSRVIAGFFAFLPFCVASGIFISNKVKAIRQRSETFASRYYTNPAQLAIANAIEKNDTALLKELIKGADLTAVGVTVHDYYGLNYLQFAVRIRSNPINFPFDDQMNRVTIRLLVQRGSPVTPALYEAIQYLPLSEVSFLLAAGADPNLKAVNGYTNILFATIGSTPKENDAAIMLIRYGADVNVVNEENLTVMMRAATSAQTSPNWTDTWRLIRYILEKPGTNYEYVGRDGQTLRSIVSGIKEQAARDEVIMCDNFNFVYNRLTKQELKK
ncbi:MAG: ankyrin repeat domain-containing protein [Chitinophagaceae bacterium]|nr:MAG: ankyrin repeat domain-containing protein [Chitinophagaceae bacterium]